MSGVRGENTDNKQQTFQTRHQSFTCYLHIYIYTMHRNTLVCMLSLACAGLHVCSHVQYAEQLSDDHCSVLVKELLVRNHKGLKGLDSPFAWYRYNPYSQHTHARSHTQTRAHPQLLEIWRERGTETERWGEDGTHILLTGSHKSQTAAWQDYVVK